MAKTGFTASNPLSKQVWEEKLFREVIKETFFGKFSGKTGSEIVHVKTDLEAEKGDKIEFGLRLRLTGKGVTGSSGKTLEGNEEKLNTHAMQLALERYRHAVRDDGALSRQRAMFDIDEESIAAIKDWGTEKVDQLHFDALTATAPTKIFYGGGKTAVDDIVIADKITPAMITKAKVWASTGGNRAQPPIRPVTVKGKKYYVCLLNPQQLWDLKQDATYQQWMREAEARGSENPLFAGADAISIDGVVIHGHENIETGTNSGSVPYSRGFLLGAQAICMGWGERPKVISAEFDYEEEHGHAIAFTCKAQKAVFNSKDFAAVGLYTAHTVIE